MEPTDMLTQTGTTGELSVADGVTTPALVKVSFSVSIRDLWTSDKESWILIEPTLLDSTDSANLDVYEKTSDIKI